MNMRWINRQWKNHGTKWLGFLTMVVAGFPQIDGLVEPGHVKYWAAANVMLGAITVQRGVMNTRNSA
jgi:hypothetical protein